MKGIGWRLGAPRQNTALFDGSTQGRIVQNSTCTLRIQSTEYGCRVCFTEWTDRRECKPCCLGLKQMEDGYQQMLSCYNMGRRAR